MSDPIALTVARMKHDAEHAAEVHYHDQYRRMPISDVFLGVVFVLILLFLEVVGRCELAVRRLMPWVWAFVARAWARMRKGGC